MLKKNFSLCFLFLIVECVTVLRFMGINATPVDFDAVRLQRPMPEELRDWIVTYFNAIPEGDYCPPLYMQNQGHSITIVGYEIHEDKKTTLLVFDPATTPSAMKKALEASNERSDKSFMRDIQEFKRSQYQLVYVTPPSSVAELNICLHKVIVGQLPGQTCFSALKYGSGF